MHRRIICSTCERLHAKRERECRTGQTEVWWSGNELHSSARQQNQPGSGGALYVVEWHALTGKSDATWWYVLSHSIVGFL